EHRRVGNVLGPTQSRPGSAAAGVIEQRRIHRQPGLAGDDFSWRDAVADNELLRVVDGDLLRDVDGAGLAHTVGRVPGRVHDALLRPEVDYATSDLVQR